MTDHANELRRHARKIPHPQGETPGVMLRAADEIERLQRVIASPYSMTRDDVIRMAREAGFRAGHIELYNSDPMPFVAPCSATDCMPELERFAALVAAAEREACAQLVEKNADVCGPNTMLCDVLRGNSAAIRARRCDAP